MNHYYVYIYYDSNGIPRYIGKGKGKRDASHEKNCQNKNHDEFNSFFHRWLRYQQDHNIPYSCLRVAENFTEPDAHDLEIAYIARFGRQNDGGAGPLTNLTDGGEGVSGRIVSEEEKQRRAEISLAAWASMTQEERDRHRNAVAAGRLAQLAVLTQEERNRRSEVRSAAHLAMWAALSQEEKERHREACSRASAATWASLTPEEKQRRSEALSAGYAAQTPEEKRAWSEALSGAQAAVWAAMTPEERQRRGEAISVATTAAWASLTQEEKKRRAESFRGSRWQDGRPCRRKKVNSCQRATRKPAWHAGLK